jgi:hypothetical protein
VCVCVWLGTRSFFPCFLSFLLFSLLSFFLFRHNTPHGRGTAQRRDQNTPPPHRAKRRGEQTSQARRAPKSVPRAPHDTSHTRGTTEHPQRKAESTTHHTPSKFQAILGRHPGGKNKLPLTSQGRQPLTAGRERAGPGQATEPSQARPGQATEPRERETSQARRQSQARRGERAKPGEAREPSEPREPSQAPVCLSVCVSVCVSVCLCVCL